MERVTVDRELLPSYYELEWRTSQEILATLTLRPMT